MTARAPRNPPRFAEWLLRRQHDTIRGDLLEEFRRRSFTLGPRAAANWYRREVFSLLVRGHGYPKMLTLDALRQDIHFAWRSYAKAPAFTALVTLTLALGIGASTAIFSIVNGILLRPLPFPEPERLLWISEGNKAGASISVSFPNFLDWRARQHSFEALALTRHNEFTLTGQGQARRVTARTVTANFFQIVGIQPVLGRTFVAKDDVPGASPVAIVSHEFWQRQLGRDNAALGRALNLGEFQFTIVGILPPGFRYLRDYDLFVAIGPYASNNSLNDRGNHQGFTALGRLKPGITKEAATTELEGIARDLIRQYPDTNAGIIPIVWRLQDRLVNQDRTTLIVLFGAVGILLLIACVNVANLLIARGATRQHELAVRSALGGGRARLLTQLLVESTLLSAAGGALGVLLGLGLLKVLVAVAPEGTPRLDEVALDRTALLFAMAAAAACGVIFGAFPAAQASSVTGQQLVIRTRSTGASAQAHRLRRGLLVVEVALALVLLAGAGLMVRTLGRLTGVDTGFRADHLLTMRLELPKVYNEDPARVAVVTDLLTRLRALPGVTTAAVGLSLPIDGSYWNSVFTPRDKPVPSRDRLPAAAMIPVSETYFDALGARLVHGRFFTAADTATSAPVTVINEAVANRIWPGEDPIGKALKQGFPERPGTWREVVGVIGDIKFDGITEQTTMQVYMPFAQDPSANFAVLVRTAVQPASLRAPIESAVAAISSEMPVTEVRTMEEIVTSSIARQRMALLVLSVFAGIALLLAASGLYGLVAHAVTERTHEIGVRMALGAERGDVIWLVIANGMSMTIVGVLLGIGGATAVTKYLEGLLFGVEPIDPITLGAGGAMLLAVSAVACWLPAWRAARIPPVTALRAE